MDAIETAYERERDDLIWQMWLSCFPNMTKENYVPFDEYKNKLMRKSAPRREQTTEEMINACRLWVVALGGKVVEV